MVTNGKYAELIRKYNIIHYLDHHNQQNQHNHNNNLLLLLKDFNVMSLLLNLLVSSSGL